MTSKESQAAVTAISKSVIDVVLTCLENSFDPLITRERFRIEFFTMIRNLKECEMSDAHRARLHKVLARTCDGMNLYRRWDATGDANLAPQCGLQFEDLENTMI